MKIEKTVLEGARVRLEPLDAAHTGPLSAAIRDGSLWEIPVTLVPHPDELGPFLADAEKRFVAGKELAFAIVDVQSDQVIGSTRFRNIDAQQSKVEIGFTFIAASWQRTYANTEAKYLMLHHAFEVWRVERVEFVTDVLNTKSRRAIERLGAKQIGVIKSHMIMRQGRVRDSAFYVVDKSNWPAVKRELVSKLRSRPNASS